MSEQSEWEKLQQSWQQPPDHPLPKLAKLLNRRSRIIWAMTVTDAIGTLAMVVTAVWVLSHKPTPFETEVALTVLIAIVLAWACVLYIRRGTWRLQAAAPAAMLDLSIRRCRASIMLALFTQYAVLVSVVYGLMSRFVFENGHLDLDLAPGTRALIGVGWGVLLFGMLTGAQWYKRRKRAELLRLEALRSELGMGLG